MLGPQIQGTTIHTTTFLTPPIYSISNHLASSPFSPRPGRSPGLSHRRRLHKSLLVVRSAADEVIVTTPPATTFTVKTTVMVKKTAGGVSLIDEKLDDIMDLFGRTLRLELVGAALDPNTGFERKMSTYAHKLKEDKEYVTYEAKFILNKQFGEIGAIYVENEHNQEMFLEHITLSINGTTPMKIICESWIHSKSDSNQKRLFFINKAYLPSQTPEGLRRLRLQELELLRGEGQGERKKFERIYDYDVYNDLGDPDHDPKTARPVLGGSKHPYPRRCRTGRPRTKTDPSSESRKGLWYVPRDESFSEVKQTNFSGKTLKSALHGIIPVLQTTISDANLGFPYFTAIDSLYNEGINIPKSADSGLFQALLPRLLKAIDSGLDNVLQFETPEMIDRDKFAWFRDEEFSRQTLAGLNPLSIQLVTEFPFVSKLDPKIYGPPESLITKELIEREIDGTMTVEEAIKQKKLFILDYHDLYLPYVYKVRELGETTLYGSRTVFFLTSDETLRPIAIELTRPASSIRPQWKQVFTHGWDATASWLWKLAKLHVSVHDSGYHQLVSHWLRTHCCTEPYIIAAHRHLSAMHPIYKLLHPHFRYTMEINVLARQSLINANGVIESCFAPGKYSIELSSVAYDKFWRFDMEALPADLIRRGMAVEDPEAEHGLRLTVKDYPYANDGLLIWSAMKEWVEDYVSHYYPDESFVTSDTELQSWWDEIKKKGHADKKNEPWWPRLNTPSDLIQILTTIIWVCSGHHAAVNFGQYHYAGYFPNRPTVARINMPVEDGNENEYTRFLKRPEETLLECLPSRVQATTVMIVLDVLSTHATDEEYIGSLRSDEHPEDEVIRAAYERFGGKLKEIEGIITARNLDSKLKNRSGAGVVPYELLKPYSAPGVTGMGVPNSISI